MNARNTRYAQDILGINAAGVKHVAGLDFLAVLHLDFSIERKDVFLLFFTRFLVADNDMFQVVFGLRDENGQEAALGVEVFLNAEQVEAMGITDPATSLKADIDRVLAHLPAYKHIAKIFIRDIPFVKTTSNKIRRSSLIYKNSAE